MFKFLNILVKRRHDFFNIMLTLVAAMLIMIWVPKGGKFKYEFQQDKPWRYDDLIAPFSFSILKDQVELDTEKAAILDKIKPYYRIDTSVAGMKINQYREIFTLNFNTYKEDVLAPFIDSSTGEHPELINLLIEQDSVYYLEKGLGFIQRIYALGIIDIHPEHKSDLNINDINLLLDNIAELRSISSLLTVEQAQASVYDSLVISTSKDSLFLAGVLEELMTANIKYDADLTEKTRNEQLKAISPTHGMIQEGEKIISRGTKITPEKFQILNSLKIKYESSVGETEKKYLTILGYFIVTCFALAILMIYFYLFEKSIYYSASKLMFILIMIVLISFLVGSIVGASEKYSELSLFVIPFCIVPISIRAFFNARTALYVLIVSLMITSFIVPTSFEFGFLNLLAGIFAIFTNIKLHYWSKFFVSSGIILIAYLIGYFGLSLVQEGSFDQMNIRNYGWLSLNVLFTLLAYPLIPIFEKIFGLVSEITLFEMSDMNKPLLRALSVKAPGTFQHSLQVANLSESAIVEIGGNPLLTRVGALYHDVGKMDNPEYFIENLGVEDNPHDKISFEESASIIIGHVAKGLDMAKKKNIHPTIIDFIKTHHGTTRVDYFYQSYLKNYPKGNVDESRFRYPGPKPFSKETGLVMLADSVEAASKSLKNPTEKTIDELVDKIINDKITEDQLINCDITFKDITTVKKIFKKMLKSIYHVRVAYPEGEEPKDV